ncbi:MAG: AMP-binding protein [Leptolyngbya sp. SIOISBB]|nr:AMP-binding protein [Leptolyngbya sp. SIOISBB]
MVQECDRKSAGVEQILKSANASLIEILQWRAAHQPHRLAYRFLPDELDDITANPRHEWSYAELALRVDAIAVQLAEFANQPVMLALPAGLDFVAAFLGCLQAGAISVPVPLPGRHQGLARWLHMVVDAQPQAILTPVDQLTKVQRQLASVAQKIAHPIACMAPRMTLASAKVAVGQPEYCIPKLVNDALLPERGSAIALLQYTSGSTSQPRGVMVSHSNLMHNLGLIHSRFGHSAASHGVIWLPPHHDMGLIGGILQPLYSGFPVTLMSPLSFLRQPIRWLQAITTFGGTTSGGPNFAYERCLQKITPEQRQGLNLRHWELAFTGAEPIRAATLSQFAETFATCGFRATAFYPCYGLAEATLFASGGAKTTPPRIDAVDRLAIAQGQLIESLADTALPLVSCGSGAADQTIAIVDPHTHQPCDEGQIGEIWLRGPSVAQGYWQQPEATQDTFAAELANGTGPFLRTGDLGCLRQGELFVTGRLKDLIIIRGQNHYPQDIEQTVGQSHPALQAQSGAAFGIEMEGEEQLIVVQEVQRTTLRTLNADAVINAIRAAVSHQHGLQISAAMLLKPGSLPITTSGKVQRQACKEAWQNQRFDAVAEWWLGQPDQSPSTTLGQASAMSNHGSSECTNPGDPVRTEALIHWLRQYANESLNSRLMDERRCLSPGVVLDFGNQGLLGMQVPTEYAGLGLGHQDMLRVLEQLGAIDPTLALFVGLNNVLGIRPILQAAHPDLQADWLPRLATGRELAAFALTESGAGSNPNAIQSQVSIATDGGWRLHGEKIWSGSAAWAGILNVFVQHPAASGISGFAITKGTPGLRQGPEALTMGMRGMVQNTVYLEGVPVVAAQLLGQPGQGMAVAQDAMMYGRLAIAAACVGGMKRCAQLMLRYSSRRQISTGRLLENPALLTGLGGLTAQIGALSALVGWIATRLDQGSAVIPEAFTACKILAPEFYWQAADDLVQCLGGRGYIEPNLAPQILRDARVLRIFEGPTETLTMHLGAQVLNAGAGLKVFLSEDLGAPDLADRLFTTAEDILARYQHRHTEAVTARRWAYLAVGKLAAIALLLAIQQVERTACPRAVEWTRLSFEQLLAQALTSSPQEIVAAGAPETAEWIARYAETIGDLEQTQIGEQHSLDPWLQKAGVSSFSASPESSQPERNPSSPPADSRKNKAPRGPVEASVAWPEPALQGPAEQSIAWSKPASSASAKALAPWLGRWLADRLKLSPAEIDPDKAFADYGVDSVMAVELAQDLEELLALKQPLDATVAWNFPTISALVTHLAPHASSPNSLGWGETDGPSTDRTSWGAADLQPHRRPDAPFPNPDLDDLSEGEMADLLAAELAILKGGAS